MITIIFDKIKLVIHSRVTALCVLKSLPNLITFGLEKYFLGIYLILKEMKALLSDMKWN